MEKNATQPLIHALVLNWNGAEEALQCLESLARQTYRCLSFLVVDNGSTDDSIARISSAFPQVALLANDQNLGFAGGVNRGLRHAFAAGAQHVLILNNDLILDEHCVAELAAHTAGNVGFISPIIYYADRPQVIWFLNGNINPVTLERSRGVRGQLDEGQFPRVMEQQFMPGGAALLSKRAYEATAGFDEGFFLYYEDADLSLRIYRAGMRGLVCSRAKMWHAISKSSGGSDSPRERYYMARSSVRYFAKHARWWQLPLILFWRVSSAVRTSWRLWRNRRPDSLRAYWRGLWHGVKDIPSVERN